MPHQALFVQGGGADGTHDEWDSMLVESLQQELGPDYDIRYPRMPNEADPEYARWKTALEKEFAKLDDGAILMGHSIGGTILISVLADDPPDWTPSGIFLIAAPFVGQDGCPSEDIEPMSNLGTRLRVQVPVYLYHGSEDGTAPFEHVGHYESAIPQAVVRRLTGRDHQLNNDLSEVASDIRQRRWLEDTAREHGRRSGDHPAGPPGDDSGGEARLAVPTLPRPLLDSALLKPGYHCGDAHDDARLGPWRRALEAEVIQRLSSVSTKTTGSEPAFETSCSTPASRKYGSPTTSSVLVCPCAVSMRSLPLVTGTTT